MTIKMRDYPLSNKLTMKNGLLILVNIFFAFAVSIGLLVVTGGVGKGETSIQAGISVVLWILIVWIGNAIINKHTDKLYDKVVEEYTIKCSKLIDQDPEEIRDKQLTVPAQITLKRIKANELKLIKMVYMVNDIEYKLKNGEEIKLSTTQALNTMQIKNSINPITYYFTVSDDDKLLIEVSPKLIHNIERN